MAAPKIKATRRTAASVRKPMIIQAQNEYGTGEETFEVIAVRPAKREELLLDLREGQVIAAGTDQRHVCVIVRRLE